MKAHQSAADLAAIAVAPLLIFIMISALANFLVLILYHGGFPQRVAWTLLMFTMGSVAIARIAIEQNRAYSLGYAAALGAATLLVMSQFIGAPLFCALMLIVIAYLADLIVRDCTIIDDEVDASGQGLIDSGRLFVKRRISGNSTSTDQPTHQPGRTVMYLALAALPLFGVGQFLLRGDAASWTRAQSLLAFYLFAALALLVTTSFLGLRRYLRQRGAEMPQDVTVSWLGGGIALIAAVLLVAYIVPLPGQALASIEMPQLFDSPRDTTASEFGWGAEGAERSDPDAATTAGDQSSSGKEIHSETSKSGGAAGDVGDGNRKDGPAGKQTGGKQQAAGTDGQDKSESETAKNRQQGEDKEQSQGQQQGQKPHAESNAAENPTADQQTPPDQSPNNRGDAGKEQFDAKRRQSSRNITDMISTAASGFGSLMKFLIMIVLAAVVARFAWLNWERLIGWLRSLFNADQEEQIAPLQDLLIEPEAPPRPFSSYQNPIGSEKDYRRIVVITFQAFEAWSREQGAPRGKDETPTEFVRRAASSIPNVGLSVSAVVDAYNRVVYGRERATRQDVEAANAVWQLMR